MPYYTSESKVHTRKSRLGDVLLLNTPILPYKYGSHIYYVKREDLCVQLKDAPPFAKIRGLYPYMLALKSKDINTVGYMDTAISMAGWGISYVAKLLNMKCVIYYPKYKEGYKYNQDEFIEKWKENGAEIHPITPPNLYKINVAIAKKHFEDHYSSGHFLPDGLKLTNTIDAVAEEAINAMNISDFKTIICNVGSGVMLAGIIRGLIKSFNRVHEIVGVLAHKELSPDRKESAIMKMAGITSLKYALSNSIYDATDNFRVEKGDYTYYEECTVDCPFPCNTYYDRKAFDYMIKNIESFKEPILFWNIGA